MTEPVARRPDLPADYGVSADTDGLLPWSWARERLEQTERYWVITSRPDGRPHAAPIWGVWTAGAFHFSTGRDSRKGLNLARNPACVVALERATESLVLEGAASEVRDADAIAAVSARLPLEVRHRDSRRLGAVRRPSRVRAGADRRGGSLHRDRHTLGLRTGGRAVIPRYSRPEIAEVWTDAHKFQRWLEVEIAATRAWAEIGVVPREDADRIAERAAINVDDIGRYIEETHHDVTAFLRSVADSLGEESRWVHYGLTSNDVWDTATSLQLVAAADVIAGQTRELRDVVARRAVEHKRTACVGRTHGVHAEPTTFGLKLAVWVAELDRHAERLQAARDTVAVGQMSGPVGTHATVPPEVEERACALLGLRVAEVTTQVIQRDRHAFYLSVLAGVGASLEKFATEIRGLQRTEIAEVAEPFAEGQTGSSSMPHKRNPELCERVAGLARTLRGYAQAGLEDVALWHERDISHSSVERIIFPDATGLLSYMLHLFTGVMSGLEVYPERMRRNLDATQGLVFSQKVLLALIEAGLSREAAYAIVQRRSLQAHADETPLLALLRDDEEVAALLAPDALAALFDVESYLTHIDATFARIGLA